jgi:hypothetical protein
MTDDTTSATTATRAGALKRLGLLATGVLGGGIAISAARGSAEATTVATPAVKVRKTRELRLYGRDWRLQRPGVEFGKLPEASDPAVPSGRIVDARERELGRFRAATLQGIGAFHLHTFDLADGTILGIGANRLDDGSYAIVGGTGRYAGASGTYTARQFLRELGGDGTAEFTLNLTAWEG